MANETKKVDRLPITDDYIFKRVVIIVSEKWNLMKL